MKKKYSCQVPRSILREKLNKRTSGREDTLWEEEERDEMRLRWEMLPAALLRPTKEFFFQKVVIATVVVILLGVFSLLNLPLTNRVVDTVHYLTVHQVDPSQLLEQIQPVMQNIQELNWRGWENSAKNEDKHNSNNGMSAPVNGVLISGFGTRESSTGEGMEMHYGIDVAADAGSPVYAAMRGVVFLIQEHPVYGLTIYLEHDDDLVTIYGRCDSPGVKTGEEVDQGQKLANVADYAEENYLHFEVWKEGSPVNPQELLEELH